MGCWAQNTFRRGIASTQVKKGAAEIASFNFEIHPNPRYSSLHAFRYVFLFLILHWTRIYSISCFKPFSHFTCCVFCSGNAVRPESLLEAKFNLPTQHAAHATSTCIVHIAMYMCCFMVFLQTCQGQKFWWTWDSFSKTRPAVSITKDFVFGHLQSWYGAYALPKQPTPTSGIKDFSDVDLKSKIDGT